MRAYLECFEVALPGLLIGVLFMIFSGCTKTRPFSSKHTNSISEMVKLEVNGDKQWVIIRGQDKNLPIVLFLHGGPGTPETPFIQKWNPELEKQVVMVYWEQRGAGKSFSSNVKKESMNMNQFIQDANTVTEYLIKRFHRKQIFLMGHSWGTLLGIKAINKFPKNYSAYIGIAQTSDAIREESLIYDWLINEAKRVNNQKALNDLKKIQPIKKKRIPLEEVSIKISWVNHFGRAAFYNRSDSFRRLAWSVLNASEYTTLDKINYLRGESFSLKYLYNEIATVNLFKEVRDFSVPVFFMHGQYDKQVPIEVAKDYYSFIKAPKKDFYVFKDSAHGVIIEEPEKFNLLVAKIVNENK